MLELLENTGLLLNLFPELRGLDEQEQDAFWHPEGDVWTHTKLVVGNLPRTPEFFFAGLFHDVGKLTTSVNHGNGRVSAHGHERVSEEVVRDVLNRLNVSNDFRNTVCFLVRHHMKAHSTSTTKRTLRRLVRTGSVELVEMLLVHGRADVAGASNDFTECDRIAALWEELSNEPAAVRPVLNGREVMELLNLTPGPEVGRVMNALVEYQDENGLPTRDEAVAFVRSLA
jgi:poly(A) polymerase